MQTIIATVALATTAATLELREVFIEGTWPATNCCRIYEYSRFHGNFVDYCADSSTEETEHDLTHSYMDNKMSSWKCGTDVAVRFCTQADGSKCQEAGNMHWGESAGGQSANEDTGIHDSLTQLVLMPYNPAERKAITVFTKDGCNGHSAVLWDDVEYNNTNA